MMVATPKQAPPRCPACSVAMLWSTYNGGCYTRGWHCNNVGTCGTTGTVKIARWCCTTCQHDFCKDCGKIEEGRSASSSISQPTWLQDGSKLHTAVLRTMSPRQQGNGSLTSTLPHSPPPGGSPLRSSSVPQQLRRGPSHETTSTPHSPPGGSRMTRRGMPNESEDNVVPGHPRRASSKEQSPHVNHFAISDPVALRILQNTFKIADARQRHFAEERELWASVEREIPLHRRSISCPGTERSGSKGKPAAAQGVQETLQGLQDSKDSGVADRHIFELQAEIKTLRRENQILQQKNQLPDSFVQASARKVSSQQLQGSAAIDPICNGHALPVRRVEAPQDYDMDKMDQLTAALAVEQGADLTGTWFYEDGEKSYEIRRDTGGLLKFIEASAGVGVLKKTHIGNKGYMVAALPHGTLRLRCRGQQIVSNFRPEGDARWGTDVIATKVTPHNDCSTESAGLVGSTYDSAAIRRRKLQRDASARNGSSVAHQVDDYSQAPNGLALKSAAASNGHGDPALADQLEQLDRFVKELQVCFKQGAPNLQR